MNEAESILATAKELVSHAQEVGIDLRILCNDGTFGNERGYIVFWRKNDDSLWYNLAGNVQVLPAEYSGSASAFRGKYHEVGSVNSITEGLELVKCWLMDCKEIDELPNRSINKNGIG